MFDLYTGLSYSIFDLKSRDMGGMAYSVGTAVVIIIHSSIAEVKNYLTYFATSLRLMFLLHEFNIPTR